EQPCEKGVAKIAVPPIVATLIDDNRNNVTGDEFVDGFVEVDNRRSWIFVRSVSLQTHEAVVMPIGFEHVGTKTGRRIGFPQNLSKRRKHAVFCPLPEGASLGRRLRSH